MSIDRTVEELPAAMAAAATLKSAGGDQLRRQRELAHSAQRVSVAMLARACACCGPRGQSELWID